MLQALCLRDCTFQEQPGWVPQLASLQTLELLLYEIPWQQPVWRSNAPALRTLQCTGSRMHKVRITCSKQDSG